MSKKVYEKIAKVVAAEIMVQKTGRNDFHHYDYATEADIIYAVRQELKKVGLVYTMSIVSCVTREIQTKESRQSVTDIMAEFTLADIDTGEIIKILFPGSGADSTDKGLYKALTGCQKYFLAKTFMIETGNDPENETHPNPHRRVKNPTQTTKPSQLPPKQSGYAPKINSVPSKAPPVASGQPMKLISPLQIKAVRDCLKTKKLPEVELLKYFEAKKIEDLKASEVSEAIKWVTNYRV